MIGKIICALLFALGIWSIYASSMDTHPYVTDTKTVNLETNQTTTSHREGNELNNGGLFALGIIAIIIAVIILLVIVGDY